MDEHTQEPAGDEVVEPTPSPTAPEPVAPVPPAPEPAKARRGWSGCLTILIAFVVGGCAGLGGGFGGAYLVDRFDSDDRSSSGSSTVTIIDDETEDAVAAVAAVAVPSVVNIDVTATRTVGTDDEMMPEGHPGVPIVGNGSGVAFSEDPDGGTFVLTNDHVVRYATRIVVTDNMGERYEGDVVGTDPNTDIAVVRIDAELPLIQIGDSDELDVGELVVAIGSPFGLQQSVTAGVVSAIGRSLTDPYLEEGTYPLVNVVQTDAAINPGNSGGALLNRAGELVGINTAIFSDTGVNDGIGFAVPVNTASRVAGELIESGTAEAPFLGIVGLTVTEARAEEEILPTDEGALVVEVTPGTEAANSGILPDDIIVSLDGVPIRSMDDLILVVRQHAVGDTVTLELWRGGELIEVEMNVGAKPDDLDV